MNDLVGAQLGNYRLLRFIGAGGYADVYLGEHMRLASQAAIKVLRTQLVSDEEIQHFQEEGRILAHLVHAHIIRIFDFDVATAGSADNVPFMVMEYAPNGSLRTRYPKGTRLAMATILPYVQDMAAALQFAHDHSFVHRDIKPENMLLGSNNEALLSDFGATLVAHGTGMQKTLQQVVGTVSYMAPEQFEGKASPASDQYSLAVIIYEWLCGDRPFHGSATEIAIQHAIAPPPPLRAKAPAISPAIEQVIMRALAKDPHQRFANIQAFASALEQAYHAQGVIAAAPTGVVPRTPSAYPAREERHFYPSQASQPASTPHSLPGNADAPTVPIAPAPPPSPAPLVLSTPNYAANAGEPTFYSQPSYQPANLSNQAARRLAQVQASDAGSARNPLFLLLAILLVVAGSTLLWFAFTHFPI